MPREARKRDRAWCLGLVLGLPLGLTIGLDLRGELSRCF